MTISVERDITFEDDQGRRWRRWVPKGEHANLFVVPEDGSDVPRPFYATLKGEQVWPVYNVPSPTEDDPDHVAFRPRDDWPAETFVDGDVILGPAPGGKPASFTRFVHRADFEARYVEASA